MENSYYTAAQTQGPTTQVASTGPIESASASSEPTSAFILPYLLFVAAIAWVYFLYTLFTPAIGYLAGNVYDAYLAGEFDEAIERTYDILQEEGYYVET